MSIEVETRSEQVEDGWRDQDGFVTGFQEGEGPRANPRGEFPTGPDIGTTIPNVQCLDSFGKPFELYTAIAGQPAVFLFQRSAVW